jgi:hypothetical protein
MRRSVKFPGLVLKQRGLYLQEFLANINFRCVQEVQLSPILLFDLKFLILPILQEHFGARRAGHIMQVIALIKTGAPPLLKGFRKRADLGADRGGE